MADPHKDISNEAGKHKSPYERTNTPGALSVKLPLAMDSVDGYASIKNYRDLAIQNLKMLLLTSPGEKMMDPMFGVGLKQFLFQPNNVATQGEIEAKVANQTKMYLPYLEILRLDFDTREPGITKEEFSTNYLSIVIHFKIKPLGVYETLDLTVSRN